MRERIITRGLQAAIGLIGPCLLTSCTPQPATAVPPGYPYSYADLERDADARGQLLIWSAIGKEKARALVADFQQQHPRIRVTYVELPAREINARILAGKGNSADFLWSSAMDLQIKLVNDGYAQAYRSPERDSLPDWANWKDQAWGTTAEPIVMVYNRKLIDAAAVPRSHVELTHFLENTAGKGVGPIATSNPVTSAVGYLYLSQDQQATRDIWRLVRAMSANKVQLFTSAEDVLDAVKAGRAAIGYNIVGSFALGEVERDATLGMMLPSDYTLLMSRIAIIPAAAPHPSAAKLFLDFLLSQRGQTHLAKVDIPSVRTDVVNPPALRPAGIRLRAIRVGPGLLVSQDGLTRRYFLKRWEAALARPTPVGTPFPPPTR